jgi:hypothetical protein
LVRRPSASEWRAVLLDELQLRILGWLVADDCPRSFGTQYAAKEAIIGKGGLIEFLARYEFDKFDANRSSLVQPISHGQAFAVAKPLRSVCPLQAGPEKV